MGGDAQITIIVIITLVGHVHHHPADGCGDHGPRSHFGSSPLTLQVCTPYSHSLLPLPLQPYQPYLQRDSESQPPTHRPTQICDRQPFSSQSPALLIHLRVQPCLALPIMIADHLTSLTFWEQRALVAQGLSSTTHYDVIDELISEAKPPPGWWAMWEPQQWLIYFHHPRTDWKHYPPAGDLIPRDDHFFCHQCNWPMRDKFGLIGYSAECWWRKGYDHGYDGIDEGDVVDGEAADAGPHGVTEVVDERRLDDEAADAGPHGTTAESLMRPIG